MRLPPYEVSVIEEILKWTQKQRGAAKSFWDSQLKGLDKRATEENKTNQV